MNQPIDDQKPGILMVTGGLGAGGKERQLINLLQFMRTAGQYSVYLAVMNPGGVREGEARNVTEQLVNIPRAFTGDVLIPLLHLLRIIKRNNIKLVHSWGSGIWDLTSLVAARLCRIPFLHGGIRSAPPSLKFGHHLSRWAAMYADAVVANSYAGLKAFRIQNRSNVKVIYNGLDYEQYRKLTIEPISNTICMVSNFRSEKDHQTLLLAMPEVIKHIPDTKLYLVGQDSGTLENIHLLIDQMGVSDKVILITDSLEPQDVIAKCQIGILSTFGEGLSNVILEYMALAKPVIATDVGGNPELVIDGTTGYLVPLESHKDLAEKVIHLLENPGKRQAMGENGQNVIEEKFTISHMGSSFKAVYAHLIH
jgi:glycosyltransferase involved in cell wall biosynthesis